MNTNHAYDGARRILLDYNQLGIVHDGVLYIGRFRQHHENGVTASGPFDRVVVSQERVSGYRPLNRAERATIPSLFLTPGTPASDVIEELSDVIRKEGLVRPMPRPVPMPSMAEVRANMGP